MGKIKLLYKYTKKDKKMFLLSFFSIIIATLAMMVTPIIIKYTIDSVIGDKEVETFNIFTQYLDKDLLKISLVIIGITLVRSAFQFFKGYTIAIASQRSAKRLKDKLYRRIQHFTMDVHTKKNSGDIMQRATSDVEMVRKFLGIQLVEIVRIIIMVVIIGALMFRLNVKLAIYAVILIPIVLGFSTVFFLKVKKIFKISEEAESELTDVLQENLSLVRVVKAFNNQDLEIDLFEKKNKMFRDKTYRLIRILASFWGASDFLCYLQIMVVVAVGSVMAINNEITLGTYVAFTTYSGMIVWPIRILGRILSDLGKALVAIERIDEVLNYKVEKYYDTLTTFTNEIKIRDLNFAYENDLVLKDINLNISKGETVGILGKTGSGKTTLIKLLLGFYPYKGSITIDGKEVKKSNKEHLRKHFGVVLQEPYLFGKSVKENIGISNDNLTKEDVIIASEIANIRSNIEEFKEKYDTIVGEDGVSLSGGQKQRLAIARALINKPEILILDDSLSAVDNETDMIIRENLKENYNDITQIIISHKVSSIIKADKIIVLEDGEIKQRGDHNLLMKESGYYKGAFEMQSLSSDLLKEMSL